MKQSMPKSTRNTGRPAVAAVSDQAGDLLKAVATALAAQLASTRGRATAAQATTAGAPSPLRVSTPPWPTGTADMERNKVVKVAKSTGPLATGRLTAAHSGNRPEAAAVAAASKGRSGKLKSTKADTGAVLGAVAAATDQFENSVVSKVSEVMTKTNKSTPAAHPEVPVISEEEIRAMSDKDYMNPAQLAFFKARLQQLEKDLLKNAGETTEHLRETVLVPDPADRATIEEEHALELRTRDRERKLLKKVQQSIASIDGGDYGWCEETGEPIGIPRLIARPTATLSLEAQQRRELKQKLYGD